MECRAFSAFFLSRNSILKYLFLSNVSAVVNSHRHCKSTRTNEREEQFMSIYRDDGGILANFITSKPVNWFGIHQSFVERLMGPRAGGGGGIALTANVATPPRTRRWPRLKLWHFHGLGETPTLHQFSCSFSGAAFSSCIRRYFLCIVCVRMIENYFPLTRDFFLRIVREWWHLAVINVLS